MRPIRRILVAVKDPAARSMPAVTKATQLAKAFGARLELFHALSETVVVDAMTASGLDTRTYGKRAREAAIAQLETLAARLRRHRVDVETVAEWDHPPHEAILRRAEKSRADLVVAERHAGAHRAKWLLSYTDWEVLRLSRAPVLLVKSPKPYHRPSILAAVDPAHSHDKPAALDAVIVQWAEVLRGALSGKLDLLHAFMPPVVLDAGVGPSTATRVPFEVIAGAADAAKVRLAEFVARSGLERVTQHVVNGPTSLALPLTATKTRSAIVVMGAVSRSGLKRLFIGGTAEAVIDSLKSDVLVVKPRTFKATVPRAVRGMAVTALPVPMY
jgi:universal stress protein E